MELSNASGSGTGEQRGMAERVKQTATSQLSSQKDRATEGLGSIANAVRQTSQPLRDNKQDMLAQYVEKAADQLEQFSTRLRERNINELMQDAQQLARRQPAVFIGAAFAAGVVAARFLKSSAENRQSGMQRNDMTSGPYGRTGSTGVARSTSAGSTGYTGGI